MLSLSAVALSAAPSLAQHPSRQGRGQSSASEQHLDAFGYSSVKGDSSERNRRMRRLPSVNSRVESKVQSVSDQVTRSQLRRPEPASATASMAEADPGRDSKFRMASTIGSFDENVKHDVDLESTSTPGSEFTPNLPSPSSEKTIRPSAISVAARRHSALQAQRQGQPVPVATHWLQSITTNSCSERATKLLDDSYREYSVSAWASAESSAWEALGLIARGIDVADRRTTASNERPTAATNLQAARTAIREARDFVVAGGAIDEPRMEALAASHQTPVLGAGIPAGMTPAEAADRYLDHARKKLAGLASSSIQAAQAMDLLAAIGLGRDEAKCLPAETALCLRRAALQGQPSNASLASRLGMQLADMGLENEASWTLQHAISLEPNGDAAVALSSIEQRRGDKNTAMQLTADLRRKMPQDEQAERVPDVIELSPSQFASISPAVNVGPSFQPAVSQQAPASQPFPVAQPFAAPQQFPVNARAQPPVQDSLSGQPPQKRRSFLPTSFAGFRLRSRDVPPQNQQSQQTGAAFAAQAFASQAPTAIIPDASALPGNTPNAVPTNGQLIQGSLRQGTATGSGQMQVPSVAPSSPVIPAAGYGNGSPVYAAHPSHIAPAPASPQSAMKRLMGKLPRLW